MAYISFEDLAQQHQFTPQQAIMMQQFYNKFNVGASVVNKSIINVELLHYEGLFTSSPFQAYVATQMFIAFELKLSSIAAQYSATAGYCWLVDETNNNLFVAVRDMPYWVGAAVNFVHQDIYLKNIYFNYMIMAVYDNVIFSGYKITLGTT